MSEKEKMLKGEIYNANYDEELFQERQYTKELCYEHNNLRPSELEKRKEVIKKLLGKTKKEFFIEMTLRKYIMQETQEEKENTYKDLYL